MCIRDSSSEIYYPVPLHKQECFADLNVDDNTLPETNRACKEILNLPIFPSLSEQQQERVVDTISGFYAAGQKVAA